MESKIKSEDLKREIEEILENADLANTTAKKVRLELEKKMGCELIDRKKEIDTMVMDFVNSQERNDDENGEESEEEEEEDEEPTSKKRSSNSSSKKAPPSKKKKASGSDEEGSASEGSDYRPRKKAAASKSKKRGGKKKGSDSENGSDGEWKKPKAAPAKRGGGAKGRVTGFTRPLTLSPKLAELMGEEMLPRHMVVKKMWAIIKEKNLYDPKNKQFAICDDAMYKVMGVKKFRTFGMLKYLKPHFLD